VAIDLATGD
jgi:hypothetical protein